MKLTNVIRKILFASFAAAPVMGFAQSNIWGPQQLPTTFVSIQSIFNFLQAVAMIFLGIVLVIGVFAFIYAGFVYLTSGGDETKIGNAKNILIYAVVGVAISVLALGIVTVVQNFIVGGNSSFF